jgi:subtilisin family serine protease
MKRILALIVPVALVAACADQPTPLDTGSTQTTVPQMSSNAAGEKVEAGEVIVKMRDGADAEAVGRDHGMSVVAHGYADAFVVLHGNAGAEHANANALKSDSRVVYAEPNYLRQTTSINPKLWAFYNPGGLTMSFTRRGSGVVTSKVSAADADEDNIENYAATGANVTIGSIDTGVDFTHPEFNAGQLIAGWDWYANDADPKDEDDHGSHTTGTMVGRTVGIAGVSGAVSHVKVYVQRVCGKRGCPTSAIVNAINAAADYIDAGGNHLVAVNMSLGGTSESQAEKDAIAHATANGVLVIASAGNDGSGTVACPACDSNAISVSATDWQDKLSSYSQYGPGLDIAAPGGECYSNTTPEGCIYSSIRGGAYAFFQGTSMAAPQVTGTAAVVASVRGLRGSALRSQILGTADSKNDATHFGAGRLNTYRAVTGNTLAAGQ